jgi:hypothetical protein
MSNPSVITLGTTNDGRFRVEDNIGEAIHIHWDSIRVDLTCSQFEQLDGPLDEIYSSLSEGTFFKDFDWYFQYLFADQLNSVTDYEQRNVSLSELRVRNSVNSKIYPIQQSEVFNMLEQNEEHSDHNLMVPPTSDSELQRITQLKERYLNYSGYKVFEPIVVTPYKSGYLILDGQHRASILSYFNEKSVDAIILTFKKPTLLKTIVVFLKRAYRLIRRVKASVKRKKAVLFYKLGGSARI